MVGRGGPVSRWKEMGSLCLILRVFMKKLTLKSLTLNVRMEMKEGHLNQHFI